MLSKEVRAVHVDCEEDEESVCNMWEANVAAPLRAANLIVPELVLLHSPFRFVIQPVVDYVLDVERQNEDRQVAVLVPELVVSHWYQNLLHNQRANLLKLMLLVRGNQRILVINIPWYLDPRTDVKVLNKNAKEKHEAAAASSSHHLRAEVQSVSYAGDWFSRRFPGEKRLPDWAPYITVTVLLL